MPAYDCPAWPGNKAGRHAVKAWIPLFTGAIIKKSMVKEYLIDKPVLLLPAHCLFYSDWGGRGFQNMRYCSYTTGLRLRLPSLFWNLDRCCCSAVAVTVAVALLMLLLHLPLLLLACSWPCCCSFCCPWWRLMKYSQGCMSPTIKIAVTSGSLPLNHCFIGNYIWKFNPTLVSLGYYSNIHITNK